MGACHLKVALKVTSNTDFCPDSCQVLHKYILI